MTDRELVDCAEKAKRSAYAPYSAFRVGAALLTEEGKVFSGCNVECASYSMTNCAERTAFFSAVAAGERCFTAIAICGEKDGKPSASFPPCGACLQVMAEFCDPATFRIILVQGDGMKVFRLKDLLPSAFRAEHFAKGDESP